MFKKRSTWITLSVLSVCLTLSAFYLFDKTFPISNISLDMSRDDALYKADSLATSYQIGPRERYQVATFGVNQMEQNFIELDNGGASKFSDIISKDYYKPYTWSVRHYMPGNVNELWFEFTPSGEAYGFHEILSDTLFRDNLSSAKANNLAETISKNQWSVNINDYEFLEEKKETQPSGRVDRTFVYRLKEHKLGKEGEYRLDLVISGDKLTKVARYIKIPESFYNNYSEMRSFNNTIAAVSTYAMILLYVLGGIIFGLFILNRQRWIVWKPAIYWALFVSVITTISGFNFIPLSWLSYNPAISSQSFILQIILFSLINGIADFVLVLLSFVAAESLTRKAFPEHIQFWKLWSGNNSGSLEVIGRTLGGYLLISLDLFFVVIFYFITANYLGWWVPSGPLFEPNMIATPFPWLSAVGMSLHAGFWEECLFRAIPISCAVLISNKYGKRRFWIVFALILQAVIFAGAHANYPSSPSYSRLVELIIPSLFWGFIYIRFGLLPVIISHFGYDVVWFSMPLFVSDSPDLIFDKIMVFVLTLIPVWVIIKSRIVTGSAFNICSNFYNKSFVPKELVEKDNTITQNIDDVKIHKHYKLLLASLFIIGLLALVNNSVKEYSNLKLTTTRSNVIEIADNYLSLNNVVLNNDWSTLTQFNNGTINSSDRFIWQQEGSDVYQKLLGSYIDNPIWKVRYVRFTGDLNEKAEEYTVYINHDGSIDQLSHKLPENREGAMLDEDSARILSRIYINEKFSLIDKDIEEVKFEGLQLPNRSDWIFEFTDYKTHSLKKGNLRINVKISGNKVVESNRYIYIPEHWDNTDKQLSTNINIINTLCSFLIVLLFLIAAAASIAKWSKNQFNAHLFKKIFITLIVLSAFSIINNYPSTIAYFEASKPFMNQFITSIFGSIIFSFVSSFIIAVVVGNLSNSISKAIHRFNFIEISLLSITILGLGTIAVNHEIQLVPNWYAGIYAINTYVPFFESLSLNIIAYLNKSIFLLFAVLLLNQFTDFGRKFWSMLLFIFLLSLLYSGSLLGQNIGIDIPMHLIKSTLWFGLTFSIVYVYFLRFDLSIIPMYVSITMSFSLIAGVFTNMYPGIIFTNIFSVLILLTLGFCLKKYMQVNENI